MLKLYYVEGINELDAPFFNSVGERSIFFNQHLANIPSPILDDDIFYYPPKFNDVITLSLDDIGVVGDLGKFNYLSITYREREYFYFIDSVVYVNEDCVNISITLDTIVTYMGDIQIVSGVMNRKAIKRWNDDATINREYFRENLSQGEFTLAETRKLSNDVGGGFVILTTDELPNNGYAHTDTEASVDTGASSGVTITTMYGDTAKENIGIRIYFLPIPRIITNHNLYINNRLINEGYQTSLFNQFCEQPNIIDMFYVPNIAEYINEINLTTSGINDYLSFTQDGTLKKFIGTPNQNRKAYFFRLTNVTNKSIKNEYKPIDLVRNTTPFATFDYRYVPAILDTNYVNMMYGEKTTLVNFPLEKLIRPNLYLQRFQSIIYGTRTYWATDYQLGKTFDDYLSAKTTEGNNTPLLKNDALNDYLAINKGTLALSPIKSLLQLDPTQPLESVLNVGTSLLGQAETLTNNIFNPDTLKKSPTMDLFNGIPQPYIYNYQVKDIDDVAKTLEGFGYKVHDIVIGKSLAELRTRRYFNIFRFDDGASITLDTLPSDRATIQDIRERLTNGIRLWNLNTEGTDTIITLGDYTTYDNLEV